MFKKLPNSTRKFIRLEKARIRRQFLDYKAQKEAIENMYRKFLNQPISKKVEILGESKPETITAKKEGGKNNPSLPVRKRANGVRARKQKVHKNKKGKK